MVEGGQQAGRSRHHHFMGTRWTIPTMGPSTTAARQHRADRSSCIYLGTAVADPDERRQRHRHDDGQGDGTQCPS